MSTGSCTDPNLFVLREPLLVIPAVQPNLDAGDLPRAVDAFFEVVCPGLWHMLDEEGKQPY